MRTHEIEELFEAPPRRVRNPRRFVFAAFALAAVGGVVAIAVVSRSRSDALAELRVRDEGVTLLRETFRPREATEGEDLRSGDMISTDATGRAQIDFFDGSLTRLDHGSAVSLRRLSESPDGREVAVDLRSGRSWARVTEQRDGDTFRVDIGEAVVNVVGTTFLTDCTDAPTCYVVGFDGAVEVASKAGPETDVGEGDCVVVDEAGLLESCDEKKLGLVDDWVKENLAEDQQLALERVGEEPTPTPTSTAASSFVPRRVTAPTPTRGSTPTPEPTDEPTADPKPKPSPKPTKKPPPSLTPPPKTPSETPFDEPSIDPGSSA